MVKDSSNDEGEPRSRMGDLSYNSKYGKDTPPPTIPPKAIETDSVKPSCSSGNIETLQKVSY